MVKARKRWSSVFAVLGIRDFASARVSWKLGDRHLVQIVAAYNKALSDDPVVERNHDIIRRR